MDELKHQSPVTQDEASEETPSTRNFKETALRVGLAVRRAFKRHPISPLFYLVVIAVLAGVMVFRSTYVKAYAVSIDGVEMGVVTDTSEIDAAVSNAESRVEDVLCEAYACNAEITYTAVYSTEEELLTDTRAIEDYIYESAHPEMTVYVLYVGDVEIGIAPSEEDLDSILARVAAPYMTTNTQGYGFLEDVTICTRQMPSNTTFDLDSIYEALTVNTIEEAYYTVAKGDTFSRIAKNLDMSIEDLSDLNPGININKLFIDQYLIIQQSVPYLSVYTYDNETYEEVIISPIEYTETNTMYIGDTKVTEQGSDGLALVNADVVYLNGYETERTVITSETLEEATTTYALKGTKEKPRTASKGYYIYPVTSYKITSKYGYRTLNGKREFHTGVDFASGYGTAIRAADGGKVTYAGWKGNYGKLVIITHDNGSQTYYAHCSSLLVSKGDKVYQGQTIAKMGSTGRSTGNHLHFEIRINGKTVNPLNYL